MLTSSKVLRVFNCICGSCGVVVIIYASHAEGHEVNPHQDLFGMFFLIIFSCTYFELIT